MGLYLSKSRVYIFGRKPDLELGINHGRGRSDIGLKIFSAGHGANMQEYSIREMDWNYNQVALDPANSNRYRY